MATVAGHSRPGCLPGRYGPLAAGYLAGGVRARCRRMSPLRTSRSPIRSAVATATSERLAVSTVSTAAVWPVPPRRASRLPCVRQYLHSAIIRWCTLHPICRAGVRRLPPGRGGDGPAERPRAAAGAGQGAGTAQRSARGATRENAEQLAVRIRIGRDQDVVAGTEFHRSGGSCAQSSPGTRPISLPPFVAEIRGRRSRRAPGASPGCAGAPLPRPRPAGPAASRPPSRPAGPGAGQAP